MPPLLLMTTAAQRPFSEARWIPTRACRARAHPAAAPTGLPPHRRRQEFAPLSRLCAGGTRESPTDAHQGAPATAPANDCASAVVERPSPLRDAAAALQP